MKEQKLLEAPIPWYHTRLFWGIVYILLLFVVLIYFYTLVKGNALSFNSLTSRQIYWFFSIASGSTLFSLIGVAFGQVGNVIISVFYYLFLAGLVYKTFVAESVKLRYPIILILLFASGVIFGSLYVSGL